MAVAGIEVTKDNSAQVLEALNGSADKILTMIGIKAERYAKFLCPTGTVKSTGKKGYRGGTLKNSITFQVEDRTVAIGSNVEYAPYVELGTGPHFTPPPEWEEFNSPRGSGVGSGYVRPRKYLQPAIENHTKEWASIIEHELKNA